MANLRDITDELGEIETHLARYKRWLVRAREDYDDYVANKENRRFSDVEMENALLYRMQDFRELITELEYRKITLLRHLWANIHEI